MLICKTSAYGIFAVLYIAKQGQNKPVQGREIAEAYGIPVEYLLKILQTLARCGILKSSRGRLGGFRLNKSADEITLYDIFQNLDTPTDLHQLLEDTLSGHQQIKNYLRQIFSQCQSSIENAFSKITIRRLLELT